jgi:polysaccharide pyruvyl transferase WcaK-like protein
MRRRVLAGDRSSVYKPSRIGLFGILGAGNLGNDASMESVLAHLRKAHPGAIIDAMCSGPDVLEHRYGVDAIPLQWQQRYEGQQLPGLARAGVRLLGKGADPLRILAWVSRHDVVIVPGAGVLEASLPVRPWQLPYSLFLLCGSGRLVGTKVALVSVGAHAIKPRATRLLSNWAARLAQYRSFRDSLSREAMRRRGIDTAKNGVYPDLVFGVPTPPHQPGETNLVAVGVMGYYGTNNERGRADEIHASYLGKMITFIEWLIASGHRVRLVVGDSVHDAEMVDQITAEIARRAGGTLSAGILTSELVSTFEELIGAVEPAGLAVAIRFHNVICAVRLAKPTIAIAYSPKHAELMADMGLPGYWQDATTLDVERLKVQFMELKRESASLSRILLSRSEEKAKRVNEQFAEVSALIGSARQGRSAEAPCSGRAPREGSDRGTAAQPRQRVQTGSGTL